MRKILIIILVALAVTVFAAFYRSRNVGPVKIDPTEHTQNLYQNSAHGFSFAKPHGVMVGEFEEANGTETIVVQSAADTKTAGFQILISLFDDTDTTITKERIKKDIPDMKIENEKEISIGGAAALSFLSNSAAFGGISFEVWFVRDGNLYQASGYSLDKNFMEQILATWKWQ